MAQNLSNLAFLKIRKFLEVQVANPNYAKINSLTTVQDFLQYMKNAGYPLEQSVTEYFKLTTTTLYSFDEMYEQLCNLCPNLQSFLERWKGEITTGQSADQEPAKSKEGIKAKDFFRKKKYE